MSTTPTSRLADVVGRHQEDLLNEWVQAQQSDTSRRMDLIGDVDLICSLKDQGAGAKVSEAFCKFPEVERVLGQGTTKASIVTAGGLQVDLRIVPPENFGAALLYFTGSKDHNVKLRGRALDMGMTLNEWGLYKISIEKPDREKVRSGGRVEKVTAHAPSARPQAANRLFQIHLRQRGIVSRTIARSSSPKLTSGARTGPPAIPIMSIIAFIAETS